MNDLISIAVLIATLFGDTVAADKIYRSVREAALTKAATGLPKLSPFAAALTGNSAKQHGPPKVQSPGRTPKEVRP